MPDRFEQLTVARDGVLAEAEAFRVDLEPALEAALRRGIERVLELQAGHVATLDEPTRRALDPALQRAVPAAVAEVLDRLRDPDVWLSPLVAPDLVGDDRPGWPLAVPEWLARLTGRGGKLRIELGPLDEPANRIWVAIGSAASTIDPVLMEFGFEPVRRRIGGGRFGVAPRNLPALDPSGVLAQRWKRYRSAFERYEVLARLTD